MARIQSQLSMKQLFWITFAVVLAVLPQLYRLPIWFLPMALMVISYRFYAQINHIKKAWNTLLMFLALLVLVLIIFSQGLTLSREISVTILISMAVLKLLETYTMRDALLVVMLCYFVTMTRFLYSQDLLLIFYLLGSAFITTHALSVLNYEKSARWFDRQQIKSTAASLSLAVPFAILFFLVFPRLGSPIWGSPDFFGEGKTGISDTMSPGSIIELFMDDSPAFRVTFDDGVVPPNAQLYWRGPVLWHFDGRTWSRQKHNSLRQTMRQYGDAETIAYQIEQENTGQNYMFSLDYVTDSAGKGFLLPDSTLYSMTTINQLRHYELKSVLLERFYQDLSDHNRRLLLTYPANQNQRTLALIRQWQAEDPNPLAVVNRALQKFNQEDFYYSFTPPPLEGEVIDEFLFESRRGFCEHYASTFTIMMRMAGIPARVVTGYQGGIDNGEYLLVKQSDAHAWSEVYIEPAQGSGYWMRIDPTSMVAPERVESGSQNIMTEKRHWIDFEWLRDTKESLDKYRYQWNQWVRDFNVSKQEALFKAIGFEYRDGKTLALLMMAILLFTALLTLIPMWWLKRQRHHTLQRLYLQLVRTIKHNPALYDQHRKGIEHLTAEIIKTYPESEPRMQHFLALYLQARYSKQAPKKQQLLQHLQKTLNQIKPILQASKAP
ncbi:transglutaminaseTgpA domain-containing protein [Marinicella meishanensis]|uniref:transglutaminase family protein n=1 Tax=Marinicella meishanensis TaxID=2873263 RepID=UPI001CBCCFBC|nr:DUF3488 and transglutaminase-like domain-containing protein [Marinicella sp. NBU2979]